MNWWESSQSAVLHLSLSTGELVAEICWYRRATNILFQYEDQTNLFPGDLSSKRINLSLFPFSFETLATVKTHWGTVLQLLMLLRSVILMVLVICAGGTICMENPNNSLIALHERFAWLVTLLQSHGIAVLWLQKVIQHMILSIKIYDKSSS